MDLFHMFRPLGIACLTLIMVGVAGCADVKRVMRYGVENMPSEQRPHWPSSPEKPRYAYSGQLIGWENFPVIQEKTREAGEQALIWLTGLDPETGLGHREDPKTGLQRPQTGVTDETGRIYVTDSGQNAVMVFDEYAGTLHVWNRATETENFASPVGIALGENQQILVADAELGRVFRISREGEPLGAFGAEFLKRPTGLARDAKRGLIYVADSFADDVKVFNDRGTLVDVIGRPGRDPATFNGPTHLAFAHDQLYVSDTLNARIQVFNAQGNFVFAFGNRGIRVGDLVRPKGVSVDGEGNIYVIESFHDHLLVYDKEGRLLLPIGGTGKNIGQFYLPSGVWTDDRDRVFVSDMFNGRVMVLQFLGGL